MVGPVPAKVRKTAVGKEEGAYFAVTRKNLPSLDAEFNGDYVTAINHGLIPWSGRAERVRSSGDNLKNNLNFLLVALW